MANSKCVQKNGAAGAVPSSCTPSLPIDERKFVITCTSASRTMLLDDATLIGGDAVMAGCGLQDARTHALRHVGLQWQTETSRGSSSLLALSASRLSLSKAICKPTAPMEVERASDQARGPQARAEQAMQPLKLSPAFEAGAAPAEAVEHLSKARQAATRSPTPNGRGGSPRQQHGILTGEPQLGNGRPGEPANSLAFNADVVARASGAGAGISRPVLLLQSLLGLSCRQA